MRPSEDRIKAFQNIDVPENKKDVQRFIGMDNYLNKFIPNLSTINKPLRELLEKCVACHWNERQESAFEQLKLTITQIRVLRYFDVKVNVNSVLLHYIWCTCIMK